MVPETCFDLIRDARRVGIFTLIGDYAGIADKQTGIIELTVNEN
jgi:hypothetical protein